MSHSAGSCDNSTYAWNNVQHVAPALAATAGTVHASQASAADACKPGGSMSSCAEAATALGYSTQLILQQQAARVEPLQYPNTLGSIVSRDVVPINPEVFRARVMRSVLMTDPSEMSSAIDCSCAVGSVGRAAGAPRPMGAPVPSGVGV